MLSVSEWCACPFPHGGLSGGFVMATKKKTAKKKTAKKKAAPKAKKKKK
jgi:hypothetical protein